MTENFQDQSSQREIEDIPQFEAWGRLISIGPNLKNVLLYQNIYSVGRKSSNKIIVKNEKISSIHCVFSRDQDGDCWLEDFSLNGIYIEGAKVGQGNQIKLLSGDLIHLLPPKKKKGEDIPGFIFSAKNNDPYKLKRIRYINEDNQELKQNDRRTHLGKEIMCKICERYIYQCVTVNPCLHNFCAACISDWMQQSQNCPQCQQQLTAVKRNKTMNEIINRYSQSNNSILRSQQECYDLDLRDKIKDQTIIIQKDISNHFDASNNVNESKSNSKRSHPHSNQNYKRGGSTKRGQGRFLRGRGGRGSRGGRGGRGTGVINLWNRDSYKNDDYESRTMKMDEIDEDDCNSGSNYFENESDQDNEYNDANNDSEEDDRYTFFDEVEEGDLGDENQIEYPQRMEESTTSEDEIFSEKNMQS